LTAALRAEGSWAEHAYGARLWSTPLTWAPTSPRPDVFAYVRRAHAALLTQDHDLARDATPYPKPPAGLVIVQLPQEWLQQHKVRRIVAGLRSLADQALDETLVIIEPSQVLVRREARGSERTMGAVARSSGTSTFPLHQVG